MVSKKELVLTAVLQKPLNSCLYDSEVLKSSFVHLLKFNAEKPRLRKGAKHLHSLYTPENEYI